MAGDSMRDRLLIVVAAPVEAEAVLRGLGVDGSGICVAWELVRAGRHDVVVCGVGKANSAGGVARVLDPSVHRGVLSLGIGGALPGAGLELGDVVVGRASVFADEGIETPGGYQGLAEMGFPVGMGLDDARLEGDGVACDLELGLGEGLRGLGGCVVRSGVIATVSTCSGTDVRAREVAERTGAVCEGMEGGAVGLSVRRISGKVAFGEVRVVSNTTGDRARQRWDLRGALGVLERVGAVL
ncbi:MAG: futalosine hydrolase [Phycisphaeraceae bacterium]|nr:MAG: futalosine hydrolase [Phycisphaeraceae bacterium]